MTLREKLTISYKLGFRDGTRDSDARIPRDRDIEHILDTLDEGEEAPAPKERIELTFWVAWDTAGENGRGLITETRLCASLKVEGASIGFLTYEKREGNHVTAFTRRRDELNKLMRGEK